MVEKSKKQKTNFVTEEDISTLLQRYTATTVLGLLQEVAQVQDVKIDWNALVKKTTTGISNVREYQMLWRHLAYRQILLDRLDDASQPLNEDSDLECELEPFPAASNESLAEAAACVKVLIASGISNDPCGSTVEAPLTINIPKCHMHKAPENSHFSTTTKGINITVPISVQKQPLPANTNTYTEAVDSNGAANANLPRRKRKPWSREEDEELINAVKKFGEGNWANILKTDFKGDRTASQLSQRWAIIRKKKVNMNMRTSTQPSEPHIVCDTNIAISRAVGDNMKIPSSVSSGANSNAAHSNLGLHAGNETKSAVTQSIAPAQHSSVPTAPPSGSSKGLTTIKKPSAKSTLSPDSMVKAAAFAAGGRIATPSDAASLLKAAQSKKAIHIMPGGSLMKPSPSGNSNSLASGVHIIRSGQAPKLHSSCSTSPGSALQPIGTKQGQSSSTRPAAPIIQTNSVISSTGLTASSDVKSAIHSVPISRPNVKGSEDDATFSFDNTRKELVKKDEAGTPSKVPPIEGTGIDESSDSGIMPMDKDAPGSLFEDHAQGGQASEHKPMIQLVQGYENSASAANVTTKEEQEIQIDSTRSGMVTGDNDLGQNRDKQSECGK